MDGYPFESQQMALRPGDSLILFTDGVTESMSVQGHEFELKGVERALQPISGAGPRVLVDSLVRAVKQHAAGRDPHDDLTAVALGRIC
jgi:sigma-B regulation protein RsbU (phosphoserine phosphatase)